MRAIVDSTICIGCTLCAQMCPEVFRMDNDKAMFYVDSVPVDMENDCCRAMEECPVNAIKINATFGKSMAKKILVVDNDQSFLEELREFLSLSGYDVVAISSAFEALGILAGVKPDLILLDLKMPAKSGFQLAGEIRAVPEYSKVPIFAMSAFVQEQTTPFLSVFGIDRYIKKPFSPARLVEEIEKMLKGEKAGNKEIIDSET